MTRVKGTYLPGCKSVREIFHVITILFPVPAPCFSRMPWKALQPFVCPCRPAFLFHDFCPLLSWAIDRSSVSAFPAGVIFPCKGTASVQPSSTAALTGSRIERQPSQIEDELSVPRRVGYSVKSLTVSLPFLFFTRCLSCMQNLSRQGSRKAPRKGKKKNDQQIKFQDYA